jgi:hypothetical protein
VHERNQQAKLHLDRFVISMEGAYRSTKEEEEEEEQEGLIH